MFSNVCSDTHTVMHAPLTTRAPRSHCSVLGERRNWEMREKKPRERIEGERRRRRRRRRREFEKVTSKE